MPKNPRVSRSVLGPILPLVLAIFAAGCSSGDAPSGADDDGEAAVSSEDALTADERAIGAAWNGEEHDDLTAEEVQALDDLGDPSADMGTGDAEPSAIRPLANCTRTTGYNKGKVMSICTTTINGKAVEQNTAAAFGKMRAAAARAGVSITVVSGFRTMQKQRELYALYKSGRGNLAAPPGYSNHQSGHALDLNTKAKGVHAWLSRNAAEYGFRRTVPSENWHYEKW